MDYSKKFVKEGVTFDDILIFKGFIDDTVPNNISAVPLAFLSSLDACFINCNRLLLATIKSTSA